MGCYTYTVGAPRFDKRGILQGWGERDIRIAEDDLIPCLCTFPQNQECDGSKLEPEDVISLACLGAAVVYARQGLIPNPEFYTPTDLPQWIYQEIRRIVPIPTTERNVSEQ